MRRILVDSARRKRRPKHGGDRHRVDLDDAGDAIAPPVADLLALDEALAKLAAEDQDSADLVKLRYFAGLSLAEAAEALGSAGPDRRPPLGLCPRLARRGDARPGRIPENNPGPVADARRRNSH